MADKDLSIIEVRLLLLKYGYQQIIQTLAKIRDDSVEKLEEDIRKAELSKQKKPKAHRKSVDDIASRMIQANPQKAEQLQMLASRYENKTFLPQLKDVKQFLERYSANPHAVKSRASATAQVFSVLASLDITQLEDYLATPESGQQNALSIIADQIIGNKSKLIK